MDLWYVLPYFDLKTSTSSSPPSSSADTVSSMGNEINESNYTDDMKAATIFGGTGRAEFIQKLSEKLGRRLTYREKYTIPAKLDLNNGYFDFDIWKKQSEFEQLMVEVCALVLAITISIILFYICALYLYDQFQHWKRNYRQNIADLDIESMKLNPEDDDPVPSCTQVSDPPSYEAAIAQLRKSSPLLTSQEQSANNESTFGISMSELIKKQQQQQQQQNNII